MYRVSKPFTFYLDGINPTLFGEGLHDLPERVADVAVTEGWAKRVLIPQIEPQQAPEPAPKKSGGRKK